jgi:hypothetical protein
MRMRRSFCLWPTVACSNATSQAITRAPLPSLRACTMLAASLPCRVFVSLGCVGVDCCSRADVYKPLFGLLPLFCACKAVGRCKYWTADRSTWKHLCIVAPKNFAVHYCHHQQHHHSSQRICMMTHLLMLLQIPPPPHHLHQQLLQLTLRSSSPLSLPRRSPST